MKYIILIFVYLFYQNVDAQNKNNASGIIKYLFTIYSSDDTLARANISEYEVLYKNTEITYFYNKHIKTINDAEKLTSVMPNGGIKYVRLHQNLNTNILTSVERVPIEKYIVRDSMTRVPWKLSKNTKKIQNIECFSAQAEYRGRVWTVWYAPSIPVSSGPWKLYGLPGMILEARDRNNCVRFECLSVEFPAPTSAKIEIPQTPNKSRNENPITTKELILLYPQNIENTERMLAEKGSKNVSIGVSGGVEIYEFEKDLPNGRKQQKLSDIPKK